MDKFKYVLIGIIIVATPLFLFPKEAAKVLENIQPTIRCDASMANDINPAVIYQDDSIPNGSQTRIKKITRTMEGADKLVLDVDYVNDGSTGGVVTLGVYPDMSAWAVSYNQAQIGEHTASVEIGLSSEAESQHIQYDSTTLRLEMEYSVDNQYKGSLFKRVIIYPKSWCAK